MCKYGNVKRHVQLELRPVDDYFEWKLTQICRVSFPVFASCYSAPSGNSHTAAHACRFRIFQVTHSWMQQCAKRTLTLCSSKYPHLHTCMNHVWDLNVERSKPHVIETCWTVLAAVERYSLPKFLSRAYPSNQMEIFNYFCLINFCFGAFSFIVIL